MCQIVNNAFKSCSNTFKILPKLRNLAKSGHTGHSGHMYVGRLILLLYLLHAHLGRFLIEMMAQVPNTSKRAHKPMSHGYLYMKSHFVSLYQTVNVGR